MSADTQTRIAAEVVPGALRPWFAAGLIGATSVHTVRMLDDLAGGLSDPVRLAVALAVRAPELGHSCLPLGDIASIFTGAELSDAEGSGISIGLELPGAVPDPRDWRAAVAESPVVEVEGRPVPGHLRPLVLDGDRLYLRRYRDHEHRVAARIRELAGGGDVPIGDPGLLAELLPPGDGRDPEPQWLAASTALRRPVTVIAGGPGTGKTYTVARMLAAMRGRTDAPPVVALVAPTGKAAARMTEAVRSAAASLDPATAEWLGGIEARTIHRLLQVDPGNPTRFRHDRSRPLPVDVVVVDETSMVSLSLADRLLDALAPGARIVFVGDPDQLASVDAGGVLGDLVAAAAGSALAESVVVLDSARRFAEGSGIARLADAIRSGDAVAVQGVLEGGAADLTWIPTAQRSDRPLEPRLAELLLGHGRRLHAAAAGGDAEEAIRELRSLGLLCARRHGPFGVSRWNELLDEAALGRDGRRGRLPIGRPVIITANDPVNGLANGDVGIIVEADGRPVAALPVGDGIRWLPVARLSEVEPVHALTIHKSQGSEYDHVVVLLPDHDSPLLTRELLYTAVTRARSKLTLVASREVVAAAVGRRTERASGLPARLGAPAGGSPVEG